MTKSNKEKAVSGVYWIGLMSGSTIIMRLLITMIISRLLNSHEFGLVASVQVLISYAEVFSMMGVGPALVQKKSVTSEDILSGNILNIVVGSTIYLVIFLFSDLIAGFMGIENILMLRVLSIVFVIHSISAVSESMLQKEMMFKAISLINVFTTIIYGLVAIILANFGLGAWALIFALIAQALVKAILTISNSSIKLEFAFNIQSIKELMYFGTRMSE